MKNASRALLAFANLVGALAFAGPVPHANQPDAPVTWDASRARQERAPRPGGKRSRHRPDTFATPALRAKLARRAKAAHHARVCASYTSLFRQAGGVTHGRFDR